MNKATNLLLSAVVGSMSSLAYAHTLDVTVTPLNQSYGEGSDVKVELSITNNGQGDVEVLDWYLINHNKLQKNAFTVTVDGEAVAYTGPIIKRPAPTAQDYMTLSAGQTITQTVDLSSFYDMTREGTYSVQFNATALDLIKSEEQVKLQAEDQVQTLSSNGVSFWVEGVHPKIATINESELDIAELRGGISYVGNCSNSQKSQISTAVSAARSMSGSAYNYYQAGSVTSRYTTWFGSYSSGRYNTVKGHFQKITDALQNRTVTADCYCEGSLSNAYAYVYPNQPYRIHLCNAFWAAPTTGTDSKAGTLIHEMSHFTVNGGTDDIAYGQYNARRLAQSSPNQAVNNADSHEYFAENSPRL
ncbi:hypothetical protein VR7878_03916 [Vibrio ruber DSM 16370]|uniref:Lysine-specific metallo-endopeptidase domain-containing protein n=1 Tax=Vibrio ruber (strain DSM 16370 / JCM 11486 / BCRC 17186 / CECT 7878 / LMG 23124 / VR1) TaxID=1123498 RepID=A0A1R4LTV4_VIBR1|nr:M35 family metallo-endopeptidase [Vibrio ruber]SJN60016.1 hypothetical protein VR7878_03916 [Vibrio ruber DSM 16370]